MGNFSSDKHEPEDFMKFPYGREERDMMTVHFDDVEFEDPITGTSSTAQEEDNE